MIFAGRNEEHNYDMHTPPYSNDSRGTISAPPVCYPEYYPGCRSIEHIPITTVSSLGSITSSLIYLDGKPRFLYYFYSFISYLALYLLLWMFNLTTTKPLSRPSLSPAGCCYSHPTPSITLFFLFGWLCQQRIPCLTSDSKPVNRLLQLRLRHFITHNWR